MSDNRDEQWAVIDCAGEYEISDLGRLRKSVLGSLTPEGYRKFHLTTRDEMHGRHFAHRLVARYFLNGGKPVPVHLEVDHMNGKPDDNRACNLQIVDRAVNAENRAKLRESIKREVCEEMGIPYPPKKDCT